MSGHWKRTGASGILALATICGCTGSGWLTYEHEPPQEIEVNIHVDHPPTITLVVVAPLQTDVGQWISLTATADDADGDRVSYLWTATGGKIDDPSLRETRLTCTRPGLFELTLTVSDAAGMKQAMGVRFNCD